MMQTDVAECAEIVIAHPTIGVRYQNSAHSLQHAWLQVLGGYAVTTAVFEERNGAHVKTVGVGISAFVKDEFIRELKTQPLLWFGPELARRVLNGDSPILSDREVRQANSGDGLSLLVWEAVPRPEFVTRSDIYQLMVSAFIELHQGFLLKEMITSQAESIERLQWAVDAGGLFWDPVECRYVKSLRRKELPKYIKEPHIVGLTRDVEFSRLGSWVGVLFNYQPPRFGFSAGEQQLLLLALHGGTDEELAHKLQTSVPALKKKWLSIYGRVAACLPELIPDYSQMRTGLPERGKEKRRHLLAYLREHREELRPVSSKPKPL